MSLLNCGIMFSHMNYDLVIAHRVCPALSKTAVGFASKFEMVKACAASLATALKTVNYRLVVILDGCSEYAPIFRGGQFDDERVEIIETPSVGNQATWARQVEILSAVTNAEFVYFSEDDYLYREDAFSAMMNMLDEKGVDFVTPLDHPDRYVGILRESTRVLIRPGRFCHWREAGTTCLTFMMRARDVAIARPCFDAYAHGNLDGVLWLGLTKDRLFDFGVLLVDLIRFIFHRATFMRILQLAAWKQFGLRPIFSRRLHLWSPIPSLAVHLSSASLPPGASRFFADSHEGHVIEHAERLYLGIEK